MKVSQLQSSLLRHFIVNNTKPYEAILKNVRSRPDVWVTSQGDYIDWWQKRENSTLTIVVADGQCRVSSSLENAVIEKFPGEFIETSVVACPETTFSGELWITIDRRIPHNVWLMEFLKREGIFNVRVADEGEFMISWEEVAPLIETIETKQRDRRRTRPFEEDVIALRQMVIDKLAQRHLPLLRVWYHQKVSGIIPKAVFSPRYDVDRAITNLGHIRQLEKKYNVESTLYLRAFCPFYNEDAIRALAEAPWCSEIGLHGEFVTHARQYGGEFHAAAVEKLRLERLTGRRVTGVCMHGGELTQNKSQQTARIVDETEFAYDTSMTFPYYFPFREIINGRPSRSYLLCHTVSDIAIPANFSYGQALYDQAVSKMDEIYENHGVFVFMQHPVYFGFLTYLREMKNWKPLAKFAANAFLSFRFNGRKTGSVYG
ncbi:MAG: hypothetical protein KDJ52_04895 [Anaerolineae bacterium]|nr:hypothetical protein [Anaerolineae bacterium]